ncbi:JAB domain-containing protein [Candidatus Pantoea formicae]|uniref:JAB domain-containing protein n=1 Tax=Candidatus Pantoea formicae TaxID=2608355 RepID=UPI003EDA44E6
MPLELNAIAVILSHNPPSCATDPSKADIAITVRLKNALELVAVRVIPLFRDFIDFFRNTVG